MSGWKQYVDDINTAGNLYLAEAESAWNQYQRDLKIVFDNPNVNPQAGRVSAARAMARFWSRTERIGMNLASAEHAAFDQNIKPLR